MTEVITSLVDPHNFSRVARTSRLLNTTTTSRDSSLAVHWNQVSFSLEHDL